MAAREVHILKVTGSSPVSATHNMELPIKTISAETQKVLLDNALDDRVQLQALINENNPKFLENRAVVKSLCADDFCYWCNMTAWLQDPEAESYENKDIPFLLYVYQEDAARHIIKAIEKGYDIPIEKTRNMGLSWLIVAIFVWGWHFKHWDCLLGSEKAEKVDKRGDMGTLIEKCRYIIENQPEWLMPHLEEKQQNKTMLLVNPEHGAKIKGDSNSTKFGRGDRSKVILLDEFSAWEKTDKAAYTSCSATAKCRVVLSTPNERGKNCWYYQVINAAKKKNLPYLRIHWTMNPIFAEGLTYDENGKPTSPWYENEKLRAVTPQEISQELDIDYESSATGKVFPDFDYETNVVENLEYNYSLPLYVGWDFGLDQTALIWIQPDYKNHTFNIIDEYVNDGTTKEGSDIYTYIDVVDSKPYQQAIHFGDPHSGNARNLAARGMSNTAILMRNGIRFKKFKKVPRIQERILAGRNIISQLRISDKCILSIDMFSSWQMRRQQTGNTGTSIPEHDIHSHIGDAYTYFCYGYLEPKKEKLNKKVKSWSNTPSGVML